MERLNGLAINVFGYSESAGIHPLYLTKDHNREPINLLLVTEVNEGKTNAHYCWIKDFECLCFDQTKHANRKFFCLRCITPHWTKQTLEQHLVYCKGMDAPPCHAMFPKLNEDGSPPTIKFERYKNMMKAPYVVFADTESIIQPVANPTTDFNTVQTAEHIPCSFSYVVVRSDGQVLSEKLYRGNDCMDKFFESLEGELEEIRQI